MDGKVRGAGMGCREISPKEKIHQESLLTASRDAMLMVRSGSQYEVQSALMTILMYAHAPFLLDRNSKHFHVH